jgi:hypothetical protein
LASGGAYVGAVQRLTGGMEVGFGFSARTSERVTTDHISGEERPVYSGLDPYQAQAAQISVRQPLTPELAWTMAYSFLNERAGMLGVQSLREGDFATAAETDAMTVGLDWAPAAKLSLTASASLGRTRAQEAGAQALAVGDDGLTTSAYEAAVNLTGVMSRNDKARLRVAQPMRLEDGHLDLTSVQVVNRLTGELGVVQERVDLTGGDRRLIVEGMYSKPFLKGMGEAAAFARMDATGAFDAPGSDNVIGASFKLRF